MLAVSTFQNGPGTTNRQFVPSYQNGPGTTNRQFVPSYQNDSGTTNREFVPSYQNVDAEYCVTDMPADCNKLLSKMKNVLFIVISFV